MSLGPGTQFGSYTIVARIGEGGMGVVYRATDTRLKRDVAIKVLPDGVSNDPQRLARFQREAEILATLNHPNIAAVYGLEQVDGMTGIVLELVEGETLADLIARGHLGIDEALPIARQIADALETAHEKGVIHRDLKPANIKVTSDGRVKVLDFGLAKLAEPPTVGQGGPNVTASPTITTPAMTQMGVILGTAAYMSPEQARGKALDKRSDVWAFGCVLFEMLTGSRAFDGEDTTDTIAAVVRAEPKWDTLPADVPPSIRLLLRRCLEKDRKKRIGDISTALFVLNEPGLTVSHSAEDGRVPLATRPPIWKWSIPALATVLTALVVVAVAWMRRPSPAPQIITKFSFTLPQGQQFTNVGRPLVAISPDGSRIVYIANRRLYLRSMFDATPKEIPGTEDTEGITTPSFSPDGRSIAFVASSDRALKKISVDGGVALTICPVVSSLGVSWSADGIIFGQRPGSIFRVSPNGGKPQVIFTPKEGEVAYGAQMLPGGQSLLVTVGRRPTLGNAADPGPDRLDDTRVVLVSLKSGEHTTLIEPGADARYLETGHIVYAEGGALVGVRFDPQRGRLIGDSIPIVEGVRRGTTPAAQFSVSNSGTLVYLPESASGQGLALFDREGHSELLRVRSASYSVPRVSPDGKRIAVVIADGKADNIWINDVSGTTSARQLTLEGNNRFPVWSADGERVVFASDRSGDPAIWWQRADGTGAAEQLTYPEKGTAHAPLSWHPHEQTLLFFRSKGVGDGAGLWTYSLVDKSAKPFAGVGSTQNLSAQFSPDGRWVAYHSVVAPSIRPSIFVRPYPSRDATVYSVAAGRHPLWSPSGSELFFALGGTVYVTRVSTNPSFAIGPATVVPAYIGFTGFWRNYDITLEGKLVTVVNLAGSEGEKSFAPQVEVVLNWTEELKQRVPTK